MKKNEIRVELLRIERDRKNLMMPYLAALGLTFGQGQARILDTLLTKDHITQKKLVKITKKLIMIILFMVNISIV